MTIPLELMVRASVIVAAGLVVTQVLTRRSAALRHAVLAASLAGAALTPVLGLALPPWHIEVASAPAPTRASHSGAGDTSGGRDVPTATASSSRLEEAEGGRLGEAALPGVLWVAGAIGSLGTLGLALLRLRRLTTRARPADCWTSLLHDISTAGGSSRAVRLLMTTELDVPATWGIWRPAILLPASSRDWDEARARIVLSHELAHVVRHDWIVQLAAECLRAVSWWNPLFWMACSRLRRESERACDDRVLDMGVEPAAYVRCVMQFARQARRSGTPGWSGAMPMARPLALERRITAMLNVHTNRTPLSRGLASVAITLAALVTVPGAVLHLSSAQALDLEGSVYDTSGAVLPEVALTLRDASDQTLTAFTDAEGHFVFPNVEAGTYVLEARLRGFKALTQAFTLGEPKDWDRPVTLQVGTVQETIRVTADRVAGSASAAAPRPARLRVGGNIRAPRKLVDVKPAYPTTMREAGREGDVSLEAIIGTDGAVHSLRVLGAHVHPDFAIAASDAVRQWRFSPTLLNGEPIEVVMDVSIGFSLQN